MFTGIVEEIGTIRGITKGKNSAVLDISARVVTEDIKIGDSIAVNGVCLTVIDFDKNGFRADVMHETLNRSSLAQTEKGSKVNLERAMSANGRFGGHIVAGHVDGIGTIKKIQRDDNAVWYTIETGKDILKYIVEKGSVAIDGISLTVADVNDTDFSISAIPHTVAVTVLNDKKTGDKVNLETDIIGKYVEKLFPAVPKKEESSITMDFLAKHGF
jgi:riboflavin synthase